MEVVGQKENSCFMRFFGTALSEMKYKEDDTFHKLP
jgi:hypothetical protein